MWLKIVLLALCLLSLFLISRLLEATLFFETGLFSTTILDPVTLSVRQLKRILEVRGINYNGVLEKQELSSLVETSGHIMEGELVESSRVEVTDTANASPAMTHFTCGSHFYEEVEDTKDSVWLVHVIPSESQSPLLDDYNWRQVIAKVKPFGIRTGMLNCYLDKRLCNRKDWHTPQLILALPRGNRAKDGVVFHSFSGAARAEAVVLWIKDQLTSRLKVIGSVDELEHSWLQFDEASPSIHVVALSSAREPPLFFTALSMKFAGRASFGIGYNLDLSGHNHTALALPTVPPVYLVITPEGVFPYGTRAGQHLTFKSMEFFLRTMQPELNDVFLVTLTLANLMACFDFFLLDGKLWKHLVKCFWTLVKYNGALFLLWLAVLGLSQFHCMQVAASLTLKLTRTLTTLEFTGQLLCDIVFWRANPYLPLALLLTLCVVHAWIRKCWITRSPSGQPSPLDSYIMSCFFRPMATLTRPVTLDLDLAEEMERLVGRLGMPNLWLQPSSGHRDYIDVLPVWRHRTVEESSESSSDAEKSLTDGDTDNAATENVPPNENEIQSWYWMWRDLLNAGLDTVCRCCEKWRRLTRTGSLFHRSVQNHRPRTLGEAPCGTIVNAECAICLESYKCRDILCGLPCGHNYHQHCILGWLLRDKHHCPTCRWPSYKPHPENHNRATPTPAEELL